MSISLHPVHGVNPGLACCFICGEPKEVILFGRMNPHKFGEKFAALCKDGKAPRTAVYDDFPCEACEGLMKKGIILISVDEHLTDDPKDPYRSGAMAVVKEDAVRKLVHPPKLLKEILAKRMAFVSDDAWDKLQLPRGQVAGIPPA